MLEAAKGELLTHLDDDVVVDRGWLSGLAEAWAENPDAAGFTGLVLPLELATEAQILFEQRGGFRRGFEKIRYGRSLPGNPLYPCGPGIFGAGANMAFRWDVLLEPGAVSFETIKFRTLYVDAEKTTDKLWTMQNDPRVTPLQRFPRQHAIDELPQLFNSVRGDTHIAGPCPERPGSGSELRQGIT